MGADTLGVLYPLVWRPEGAKVFLGDCGWIYYADLLIAVGLFHWQEKRLDLVKISLDLF